MGTKYNFRVYLERAHPAFLTTIVVLVFVPNELKSPKTTCFLFFSPHLGDGWVGKKQMGINPHIFLNPSLRVKFQLIYRVVH